MPAPGTDTHGRGAAVSRGEKAGSYLRLLADTVTSCAHAPEEGALADALSQHRSTAHGF